MNKPTQPLFAYGTLQDAQLQQMLFGRVLVQIRAELPGWSLHAGEDGYLFIKPEPADRVSGSLLAADAAALRAADQWEEVPLLYQRENVLVKLANEDWQEAWAYTRRNGAGTPHAGGRLSLLDRQAVLKAAAKLSLVR